MQRPAPNAREGPRLQQVDHALGPQTPPCMPLVTGRYSLHPSWLPLGRCCSNSSAPGPRGAERGRQAGAVRRTERAQLRGPHTPAQPRRHPLQVRCALHVPAVRSTQAVMGALHVLMPDACDNGHGCAAGLSIASGHCSQANVASQRICRSSLCTPLSVHFHMPCLLHAQLPA